MYVILHVCLLLHGLKSKTVKLMQLKLDHAVHDVVCAQDLAFARSATNSRVRNTAI